MSCFYKSEEWFSLPARIVIRLSRFDPHESPFIEWAGRYPIRKKSSDRLVATWSDNHIREAELQFWERLVPLLHKRARIMKGGPASIGGYKLYMDGRVAK